MPLASVSTEPSLVDLTNTVGLDALADPGAVVLVEWPERGAGALPAADIELRLGYAEQGRQALLRAFTPRGEELLARLG